MENAFEKPLGQEKAGTGASRPTAMAGTKGKQGKPAPFQRRPSGCIHCPPNLFFLRRRRTFPCGRISFAFSRLLWYSSDFLPPSILRLPSGGCLMSDSPLPPAPALPAFLPPLGGGRGKTALAAAWPGWEISLGLLAGCGKQKDRKGIEGNERGQGKDKARGKVSRP